MIISVPDHLQVTGKHKAVTEDAGADASVLTSQRGSRNLPFVAGPALHGELRLREDRRRIPRNNGAPFAYPTG